MVVATPGGSGWSATHAWGYSRSIARKTSYTSYASSPLVRVYCTGQLPRYILQPASEWNVPLARCTTRSCRLSRYILLRLQLRYTQCTLCKQTALPSRLACPGYIRLQPCCLRNKRRVQLVESQWHFVFILGVDTNGEPVQNVLAGMQTKVRHIFKTAPSLSVERLVNSKFPEEPSCWHCRVISPSPL